MAGPIFASFSEVYAFRKLWVEVARPVGEDEAWPGVGGEQLPVKARDSSIKSVGGRHRRQSEVDPPSGAMLHQAMGKYDRGLRFPAPHHIFEDEETRIVERRRRRPALRVGWDKTRSSDDLRGGTRGRRRRR
jgi:hypothetical protein